MLYNILLIDEHDNTIDIKNELKDINSKTITIAEDLSTLSSVLQENTTHIIIINTNILELKVLADLFSQLKIDFNHIPILILNKNVCKKDEEASLLIFDYIDFPKNKNLIKNKVKFCQHLYKKELEHEEKLKRLLYIDNLTQLPNRVKLIKDIQDDEIGINSLAVIDIKSFKEINDFFGNRIGDQVLKAIVRIINSVIKFVENKVTLYKFSADVYCISNYGLTHKDFENIIIYVLGAIKSEIIKEDEYEIDVNATAGITFSPKNNKLITADLALQAAKKQNKDYIVFYEELDDLREYENNMLWTKKLKNALDKDNIIVYYQPLINNKTKKVDKYECLVRLYDEDENKVVAPFFFLNVSKKANLYTSITKIVIDKSFKEFENLEFEFSINVSYEDIADKNFLIFIENRLKKYKVAQRVVWEILEDESIKDYEVLINFINEVKKMGCKIAIDDFGSGYSNFEHILKMNVDYLKIDASLIKYIVTDKNSFNVVKTVVDFAKSLGIKTIAEYVENEDIFNITRDLKIDFSQGYYFSAPIAKPELKQF
jgi:diguanylate cyclase (GGDEF)-like protein